MEKISYATGWTIIKDYIVGDEQMDLEIWPRDYIRESGVYLITKYPSGELSNSNFVYAGEELRMKSFSAEVPLTKSVKRVHKMIDDVSHAMGDPYVLEAIDDMIKDRGIKD
jgi:hypothetical protein